MFIFIITCKTQSAHIKQLQMDRNSKEIYLAKQILKNYHKSKQSMFPVKSYLKDHSSQMQMPYVFKIKEHNILFNLTGYKPIIIIKLFFLACRSDIFLFGTCKDCSSCDSSRII